MKVIKKFIVILSLLLGVFITINNVDAEIFNSNIDENDFFELSNKDDLIFNNFTYYLEAYAKSIIGVDNPQPEKTLYACNSTFYTTEFGSTVMKVTGDDPIVSLVPKEAFKTPNISKVHIGKEYGFFIKTKSIDDIVYTNVYLFDITNDFQKSAPSHYKFMIKPLFQREYVYFETPVSMVKTQTITPDFSQGFGDYNCYLSTEITTNDVVSPLPYASGLNNFLFTENKEFYLSNVKNIISLANEQHLNYGQEGYNPYDDKGMFITQQDMEYQAKVYNVNDDSFIDAAKVVIKTGLGHGLSRLLEKHPSVSVTKEILDACTNIHDAASDEIMEVGNKLKYTPKYVTADAQIENYTYLAKSTVVSLGIDETNGDYGVGSYLFFDNNDYVSFDYQLGYTPVENETGYNIPWETRVVRGFSLTFNSFNNNEVIQESDSCILSIFNEHEREYKELSFDSYVNILPEGENLFTFTPNKSGHYSFITGESLYVPNIEMIDYNYEINTTVINDTNVKTKVYLQKGVEYKFRVSYSEIEQFGLFNIYFEYEPIKINLGNNQIELLYDEYYYKFIPDNSAYYKIMLDEYTFHIYDSNLNIQSVNVDGYSILNNNEEYYICLNKSNYNTNNINLLVMDRIEISFYNDVSDSTPIEKMYYSTINHEELYVSSKEAYNFIGWQTNDGILVGNINNFIEPNLRLYAKWEPIIYTISYYGIDGLVIKTDTYTIETGFKLDDSISIENYIILSWLDKNGNIISNFSNIIGNVECYPNWVKEKSVVTFDVKSEITDNIEATLVIESIILNYGECVKLPMLEISGFKFEGWYNGDIQITDDTGQMFSNVFLKDDTILLAKWLRTEYHFYIETIESNGSFSFELSTRNGVEISNYIIPTNAVSEDKFSVEVINDKLEELFEEALINNDLTMELYKPGYHFEYCTSILNDSSSRVFLIDINDVENGFILYPFYESNEYTINLYDGVKLFQTMDLKYELLYENYINKLPSFVLEYDTNKIGYIYQGMCIMNGTLIFDYMSLLTEEGLNYIHTLVNFHNIDLKISETPINYKISYNSNGGSGVMLGSEHVYDTIKSLNKNTFLKTGYDFTGWNTKVDGSGTHYSNYEAVVNVTFVNNETVILYAQWEPITYNVMYIPNGGNGNEYSFGYRYDQEFNIINSDYSKTGYTFIGWSKTSNGSVEYLVGETVKNLTDTNNDTVILYAVWKANTYTITYKNLLKSMYKPYVTSYTYGTTVSLPTSIEYSDGISITEFKNFNGWYEDSNFSKSITEITPGRIGNIELYASYDYTQYVYTGIDGWTVTDDDGKEIIINIHKGFNSYVSEINGVFDKVTIKLSLMMKEKNDGYQEITLYCVLYNDTTKIIFEDTAYEYGGSNKNTNYSEVVFDSKVNVSDLNNYNEMYLKLGAHGNGDDDWQVSCISVSLHYSFEK